MTDGLKVTVLASQLLRHAAEFFDFVAGENPDLADMMGANRDGYLMMADRLDRNDTEGLVIGGFDGPQPALTEVVARMLADAADFFENVGEGNADHAEQMTANAEVFRLISDMLLSDPEARLPADA